MRNGTKTVSSRPRGRPRSFDEGDVLDKASRVFMERGFSATSLDDLSEATGLKRPSLYSAFGDKQALYIAALKRYGDVSMTAIETIMARKIPIAERVEQCLRAAINLYRAGDKPLGCMIVTTATVEAPSHPQIAEKAAELVHAFEGAFEGAFKRAVDEGELSSKPPPATRARLMGAVLDTLAVRARMGATASSLKAYVTTIVPAICG